MTISETVKEIKADRRRRTPFLRPSLFVVVGYTLFGTAWILAGNFVHNWWDGSAPLAFDEVETGKGLVFVALSAVFVHILQRADARRKHTISNRLRRAEYDLFTERRRLEEILTGTRAGTWEWNVRTGETVFNERWAEIIGYTLKELEPISIKTWISLTHPDDLAASDAALKKHFAQEIDYYECEARMRHKNGEWVWVADRGKVVEWTPDEKPVRLAGTHLDITAQKRDEIKLANLLKMRDAVMNCHAAILRHRDEQTLLQQICDILVEKRSYDLVWMAFPNLDPQRTVSGRARAGHLAAYVDEIQVHWGDDALGSGPTGAALRTGTVQVIADISAAEAYNPWRGTAEKYGFQTSVSVPIRMDGHTIAALNVYSCSEKRFDTEEVKLLEEFSSHLGLAIWMKRTEVDRDSVTEALKSSSLNIITAVSATIEKRDPYTAGHQSRVSELAVRIAQKLGWDHARTEGLRLGALIHDIGKIYVPAEILNRPGRLTPGEFSVIQSHPEVGAEILSGIKFPWPIQEMILQHHERVDGTGYPRGLKGDEILPEAKILAVADVVEAITSHRPYRPGRGIEVAKQELTDHRGTAYAPDTVDACLAVIDEDKFTWSTSFGQTGGARDERRHTASPN
ncbi:MAG: HD domain-containing phosphohydrolase [Rhodospirillaceae bacterium]